MPSETWTQSKVAQIAKLTQALKESEDKCKELGEKTGKLYDEAHLTSRLYQNAKFECDEAVKKAQEMTQLVGELKIQIRDLYQAAQNGVCKKCWKEMGDE